MKENSGQWVVKLQSNQVKGPFSTDELRNMIIAGSFTGSEEVCEYPQGEWQILTKQTEFYDALLESLENPIEAGNARSQKMDAETVIKPPEKEVVIPKFDLKEFVEKELKEEELKVAARNAPKKNVPALTEVENVPARRTPVNNSVMPAPIVPNTAEPNASPDIFDARNKKHRR